MWDFVGKSRNLEHVNEELEVNPSLMLFARSSSIFAKICCFLQEYKAEMERQQTVLRDLAAEKAVKVT